MRRRSARRRRYKGRRRGRFCRMLRIVTCDSRRAARRSLLPHPPSSSDSADSMATSVPCPSRSDVGRRQRGASSQFRRQPWRRRTLPSATVRLSCPDPGAKRPPRSARRQACAPTASAVARLSPVGITTRTPSFLQRLNGLERGRLDRVRDDHHAVAASPSIAAKIAVAPCSRNVFAISSSA